MASDGGALPQLLDVELRGLLVHLWGVHIVEQLLDGHCLVHELQPDSDGDFDLSMFKLCAWCDDLEGLPSSLDLHVQEPPVHVGDESSFPRMMVYPVSILVSCPQSSLVESTPSTSSVISGRTQ